MGIEPEDLSKFALIMQCTISQELLEDALRLAEDPEVNVNPHVKFFKNEYMLQIKSKIWGREDQTYDFEWYASWWQELRERILPGWWLRDYPSRLETKKRIQAVSTYPTLRFEDDSVTHKAAIHFEEKEVTHNGKSEWKGG